MSVSDKPIGRRSLTSGLGDWTSGCSAKLDPITSKIGSVLWSLPLRGSLKLNLRNSVSLFVYFIFELIKKVWSVKFKVLGKLRGTEGRVGLNILDLTNLINNPNQHDPAWLAMPTKLPSDITKFEGRIGENPSDHIMSFHLWCYSNRPIARIIGLTGDKAHQPGNAI